MVDAKITRVLLVRHGGTVWNAQDRFAGAVDVELSGEGRQQAKSLGHRLAGQKIAAAYCSPMRRAIDTAALICESHDLHAVQRMDLREINHGRWEGRRQDEVKATEPAEYAAWESDPYLIPAPGGEPGVSVLARAMQEMGRIVRAHEGKTVLVVSHKATIRLILCSYAGIDPRFYRQRLAQDNACLNVLDCHDPRQARLMLVNDISHYGNVPQ